MQCEKRTTSRVLDNLSAKLGTLPQRHPERPHLIRMMIDIRREIERPKSNLFPTATDRCCAKTKLVEAADLWVAAQEALVAAMQGCKETEAEQPSRRYCRQSASDGGDAVAVQPTLDGSHRMPPTRTNSMRRAAKQSSLST